MIVAMGLLDSQLVLLFWLSVNSLCLSPEVPSIAAPAQGEVGVGGQPCEPSSLLHSIHLLESTMLLLKGRGAPLTHLAHLRTTLRASSAPARSSCARLGSAASVPSWPFVQMGPATGSR